MGGGGTSTNTIQNTAPWGPQQPYLQQGLTQAASLYANNQPQAYTGPTIATPGAATTQSESMLANAATGNTTALANAGANATQFDLNSVLYPQSNPALQSTIQAAIDPLTRNFNESVLPGIRESYAMAQPGGGSREGVAEGIAASNLNQQVGDVSAQIASQGYGQGLVAQGKALADLPSIIGAQASPATQLGAVGGAQDAYTQAMINQAIQQWNSAQMLPWNNLGLYENLLTGNLGGSGTSSATGEAGLMSGLQGILGTGLMGLAGYNLAAPLFSGGGAAAAGSTALPYFAGAGSAADTAAMAAYFGGGTAAAGAGATAAEAAPIFAMMM
jgi:hypothetical protein